MSSRPQTAEVRSSTKTGGRHALERARILDAMVHVADERGFAGASETLIARYAGVSRQVFREHFASVRDCFLAVMDDGSSQAAVLMAEAFASERSWVDGARTALVALLELLESDPRRARVWQLEVLSAGGWALEHRERKITELRRLVLAGPNTEALLLAVDGVMAGVLGLIQSRLLADQDARLIDLLGTMMGLVVAPFVDAETRAREIARGEQHAQTILEKRARSNQAAPAQSLQIPRALLAPTAHRARACIRFICENPHASNRQVAAGIGVTHQGQVSTLLARLQNLGLLTKSSAGIGHSNSWTLTEDGIRSAQALAERAHTRVQDGSARTRGATRH